MKIVMMVRKNNGGGGGGGGKNVHCTVCLDGRMNGGKERVIFTISFYGWMISICETQVKNGLYQKENNLCRCSQTTILYGGHIVDYVTIFLYLDRRYIDIHDIDMI